MKPDNKKKVEEKKRVLERPSSGLIEHELGLLRKRAGIRKIFITITVSLLFIASVTVLLSMLLLPIARVNMNSMFSTLHNGDFILFITAGEALKGDIVAFRHNNTVMIKRVIALAGETVGISEDGTVTVDGILLKEPYVNEKSLGICTLEMPYTVPEGRIFVMGDNRPVSIDSRSEEIGMIDLDRQYVGRALFRIWPVTRMGRVF